MRRLWLVWCLGLMACGPQPAVEQPAPVQSAATVMVTEAAVTATAAAATEAPVAAKLPSLYFVDSPN